MTRVLLADNPANSTCKSSHTCSSLALISAGKGGMPGQLVLFGLRLITTNGRSPSGLTALNCSWLV